MGNALDGILDGFVRFLIDDGKYGGERLAASTTLFYQMYEPLSAHNSSGQILLQPHLCK
jgi:hypothetical protein